MTSDSSSFSRDIDEQASLWAARLDGSDLSNAQCAELDAWLAAAPEHRDALAEYTTIDAILEEHLSADIEAPAVALGPPNQTAARSRPRVGWWWGAGLAAAAAVVIMLSTERPGTVSPERIATAIAQRQSVELSDGTAVQLNAHTNLVFEATSTTRRARLGGGQAFFEVDKDPDRPFIVDTPLGSVRVTGTAFDISTLTDDAITVTVTEGSVEVRLGEFNHQSPVAPIRLQAHDQLLVSRGQTNLRQLSAEALADEMAWRDGYLVVDDMPLAEVLVRFAHFHGRGISAAPDVARLSLSGRFPIDDLDAFLLGIETLHPVRVLRDQSGTIRIVSRS
ncbi:MAG: pyoverdine signaling pathway anti-sigma factor FpvR [Synoicihabitans sp.]